MARVNRSWYRKKTNWAILIAALSQVIPIVYPPAIPACIVLLKLAAALGVYGVADRAGKANEEEY